MSPSPGSSVCRSCERAHEEVAGKVDALRRGCRRVARLRCRPGQRDRNAGAPIEDLVEAAVARVLVLIAVAGEAELGEQIAVERIDARAERRVVARDPRRCAARPRRPSRRADRDRAPDRGADTRGGRSETPAPRGRAPADRRRRRAARRGVRRRVIGRPPRDRVSVPRRRLTEPIEVVERQRVEAGDDELGMSASARRAGRCW